MKQPTAMPVRQSGSLGCRRAALPGVGAGDRPQRLLRVVVSAHLLNVGGGSSDYALGPVHVGVVIQAYAGYF